MKSFLERIRKDRKKILTTTDALTSKSQPGPATLTSTMITSATNPMASVPDGCATASVQVAQTTDVTVSLQLGPSHRSRSIVVIDQTGQLGVPVSVSTLVIDDIVSVEEHDHSVCRL